MASVIALPLTMYKPVGLRARLFGGILIVLLIAVSASAVTIWQFIEALEVTLVEGALRDRMAEFAAAYTLDHATPPPHSSALRGFVADSPDSADLPRWLGPLGQGMHEDVTAGDDTYYVLRQDVGTTRLYLTQNIDALEHHEAEVVQSGIVGLILAVMLAGVAALAVARIVLGPMFDLAQRVSRLGPGERGVRIGRVGADREVAMIAGAFDAYLEQLDAFVMREQAFTGDVSHELRTPLATILSAVQLMLSDATLSTDQRLRLQRIERAAEHMRELSSAMLFLARQPEVAERQLCDIGQILEDVVQSYRDLADGRALDLRLTVLIPDAVFAPHGMVTSVVGNLVGNAVEHASGGVDVHLEGRTLTVSDDGPGIPGNDMSRIFERGYRGSNSRGSGLGLALVRRICDHLGWAVDVESREGRGTRIRICF